VSAERRNVPAVIEARHRSRRRACAAHSRCRSLSPMPAIMPPPSTTRIRAWLITGPCVRYSPGSSSTASANSPISNPCMSPHTLRRCRRQPTAAKPTVKQHLAAIRTLFDWLIIGQVLAVNPAHAVRGPKHVVRRGMTPMPAHHKLEHFIDEYLAAAGIREDAKTPLFRSAIGKTGVLTDKPMNRVDAYHMIRRRTAEAGLKGKLGCHVFRATGITASLEAGGTLENAQAMAAHESPRTTKLYDRTGDEITLDEVERIAI
jgi:site-specific recombinase XerC